MKENELALANLAPGSVHLQAKCDSLLNKKR